jgi:hypothetical protein
MYKSLACTLSFPQFCVDKSQSQSQSCHRRSVIIWTCTFGPHQLMHHGAYLRAQNWTAVAGGRYALHWRRSFTLRKHRAWQTLPNKMIQRSQSLMLFHQNDWCSQCTSGYHSWTLSSAHRGICHHEMKWPELWYSAHRTGLNMWWVDILFF